MSHFTGSDEKENKKRQSGASIIHTKADRNKDKPLAPAEQTDILDADIVYNNTLASDNEYKKALQKFEEQSARINSYLSSGSRGTFLTHSNLVSSIPPAEIQGLLEAFVDVCASVSSEQGKVIFERAKAGLQTAMLLDEKKNKKTLGPDFVEQVLQSFEANLMRPDDQYKPTEEDLTNIKQAMQVARKSLAVLQDNAQPKIGEQLCAYFGAFIGAAAGIALGPLAISVVGIIGLIASARYFAKGPQHTKPSPEGLATAGVLSYTVALPVLGQVAAIGLGILGAVCGSKVAATLGRRLRAAEIDKACDSMHTVLRTQIGSLKKWEDKEIKGENKNYLEVIRMQVTKQMKDFIGSANNIPGHVQHTYRSYFHEQQKVNISQGPPKI